MSNEQFERAKQLTELILVETGAISRWNASVEFWHEIYGTREAGGTIKLSIEHMPFDIIKAICIQKHTETLNNLQTEFNNL